MQTIYDRSQQPLPYPQGAPSYTNTGGYQHPPGEQQQQEGRPQRMSGAKMLHAAMNGEGDDYFTGVEQQNRFRDDAGLFMEILKLVLPPKNEVKRQLATTSSPPVHLSDFQRCMRWFYVIILTACIVLPLLWLSYKLYHYNCVFNSEFASIVENNKDTEKKMAVWCISVPDMASDMCMHARDLIVRDPHVVASDRAWDHLLQETFVALFIQQHVSNWIGPWASWALITVLILASFVFVWRSLTSLLAWDSWVRSHAVLPEKNM